MVIVYFLFAIIAVIFLRALMFKPTIKEIHDTDKIEFDKNEAVTDLARLVRCKTISRYNPDEEDNNEFDKLMNLLRELYPEVFKNCELKTFPGRALLFKWKGRTDGESAVFLSHYDVVPADESLWNHAPFSGDIADGFIWGRGTLDNKNTLNGILLSAETLLRQGFIPENDIYFAFSGGEEIGGKGAKNIADYLKDIGVKFKFILDEGGAVTNGIFPGVDKMFGLVGVAEKGVMNLKYTCRSDGGHASAPLSTTSIGKLSKACYRIEKNPFKAHFIKPTSELFDCVGRYTSFKLKLVLANLWLFKPVLFLIGKDIPDLNAMLRTTVAFTQMSGSDAPNVFPTNANMISNIRLFSLDSSESVIKRIKSLIKDDDVEIEALSVLEASKISRTDCDAWNLIKNSIEDTWTDAVVAPYLMVMGSDAIYYSDFCDKVYRFSAFDCSSEERQTIHGNNERIKIETVHRAVEFFIRIMKKC